VAQANALYHTKSPVIPPAHFYQDSHFVHTLIETISSGKTDAVQSLLFPPSPPQSPNPSSPDYLINAQDARGWSPIHYCVSSASPAREILDALYLAGADISVPTAVDSYTPLHCLALTSCQPMDALDAGLLYSFTVHLVRDLRAPLGAQDRNGETCIHIAAERGVSVDVLSAFLDCDPKSVVREIRNSRG
jgi:ankyrin repeat protein